MRLTSLTQGLGVFSAGGEPDPEIAGLAVDSRAVAPGFLFAALPGARADGRAFIADALARGAVAVLTAKDPPLAQPVARTGAPVALIADANPRRLLALLAARFYACQPKIVVAITGTNGKSSVAEFTRQLWAAEGSKAASLGTLGVRAPNVVRAGALTTPDAIELHRVLAELAGQGVERVALEASSHGLAQYRLDGLTLAAAAFTNLTRDHLDYHADVGAYFAAKARLFDSLLPTGAGAVLNADVAEFTHLAAVAQRRGIAVLDYGRGARTLKLERLAPEALGQRVIISHAGRQHEVLLPLAGAFQAMNALAALGLALATGSAFASAFAALGRLAGVRGRLELVARHANGAPIYVDYAHTPDALTTVLGALRPHVGGRLVALFGAGGDRDPGKRPLMGAAVAASADLAIVTDDNPRSEDPSRIRAAIIAACPGAREIPGRGEAIRQAVRALAPGDALLLAGKGHEDYQIIGDRTLPFDDAEVAREAVAELGAAA